MQAYKRERPTIGVLAGWQAYAGTLDSFLNHVFRGIQSAARDRECNLLIACGVGSARGVGLGRPAWPIILPEVDFVPVGPWNCDGLIVVPPLATNAGAEYFQNLIADGYPLVYAGDRDAGPAVIVDNQGGIHQALLHLFEHGHRRIAFIAGRVRADRGKSSLNPLSHEDSGIRLRAYKSGLERLGLPLDPDLIVYGYHTYPGGRQAIAELLRRGVEFSAILASNDESALGAMDTLHEAGRLAPQDIAVIGFDDRLEARAQVPSLTTVHFPMFEMGYQSVGFLLRRIQGAVAREELIRIPTRLVIRESCGCLPGIINQTAFDDVWQRDEVSIARQMSAPVNSQFWETGHQTSEEENLEQVSRAITAAAYNESQLSLDEVNYLCQRLVEAFRSSLAENDPMSFHQTIRQILERVSQQGDDLYAWQATIAILRQHLPAFWGVIPTRLLPHQIEDMLHQAHIAASEISRGQASQLVVRRANIADQLGRMTTHFFAVREEEELFQALASNLPTIGIQHVAVAFFEAEEQDSTAWSVLRTPALPKCDRRFRTRQFPPERLYPTDKPFDLVVLPLLTEGSLSGFVAFQAGDLELCASVVRQLVAALRSVRLYREAVEARQLAEEANRLKSRFLSTVSHELRTPLNLITGLSDMLLRQSEQTGPEECKISRKDLERIYIGSQHLDALIRDVLDLAQSDMGQLKLACEPLDLRDVLEAVSAIGEQLARDKALEWRVEIAPDLPRVWGDRTRLRQVVLNLVNNAVKFTARGEVALAAHVENDRVIVSVSDTGLGIPIHEQGVIFNEFRQSDRTAARGYGGLGLGLAICKRLVEMHNGQIDVYSSGEEGEGSAFYFTVPVLKPPSPSPKTIVSFSHVHRVLLLTKDVAASDLLKTHLSRQGFMVSVRRVDEGEAWLNWLFVTTPDVVVLDLDLTSERGWEILKVLKENPDTQNIPVLFYSLAEDENSGSLLEMDYLTKPMGSAALAETLFSQGLLGSDDRRANQTILVVDDDPGILELHVRIVEGQLPDYQVLKAHNGHEALKLIRQRRPALVLLDLMMPEMDGFTVLETMRQEDLTRDTSVIVVTGQVLTAEDMARLNCGVASVLGKGMFSVEETLDHITAALAHKRKPGSEMQRMVLKAMAFIHTHYTEQISRRDIAAYVGLSERHLTRCFHQELGVTPIAYLNRYRVRQAKALLERGSKGITEVAMEVGFSSSGYFTRVFRQEVGVPPRAYLRAGRS